MDTLEKAEFTSSIRHIEILKIRNRDLQFRKPGHGWQNEEKKTDNKTNTGNCKALSVSRKQNRVKKSVSIRFTIFNDI